VRVDQSQLIGRVGQTGTATGPHLDYRVVRNGRYVNPVTEMAKMPPGEPIAVDRLEAFRIQRDQTLRELAARLSTTPGEPPASVTP
jgi:hypothetical protein